MSFGIFNSAIFNNAVFNTGVSETVFGIRPSGGIPATLRVKGRTRKQLEEDRQRFGITAKAADVIEGVAKRQAETLEADEQKRFEELERQLALEKIGWNGKYLAYLNEARAKLIDEEIAERLKEKLEEEELMITLVLTAAVV